MEDLRIFLTGKDGVGWSIDHDRLHTQRFLRTAGARLVRDPFRASVVHSVWWPLLLNMKALPVRLASRVLERKILAVVTNKLDATEDNYTKARKYVNLWVAANRPQQEILLNDGVEAAWQPFYVDETLFKPSGLNRDELCVKLGIDYASVKNRFLIGNFQRDTLGSDLTTPKQQKDPDRLTRILSGIKQDGNWLLVLAGPRRHYIISECERIGIPYIYVGHKPTVDQDDLALNMRSDDEMALLNDLIDCSITTSQWEGGPKAILEAAFTCTYALSTPVGNAPELLHPDCIYETDDEAIDRLAELMANETASANTVIEHNFANASELCSFQSTLERWRNIYRKLLE